MSEPWRFCCPSCGSVQVVRRKTEKPGGLRRKHRKSHLHAEYEDRTQWYCRGCNSQLESVVDKKTEKRVIRNG